eukprot:gnl/Hemi2/14164_TR4804_c0_g1_i1.p1 gnl/Hemi2/14164_TR4804_c0_g1~~gnl/Hemi2/14164_TR4804_c0_g1_i1.p1  ORF type:complete len:483 (-),score=94.10 gnl/Hemi2/14164_TR4804_c0_g1_i1:70-1518(-)
MATTTQATFLDLQQQPLPAFPQHYDGNYASRYLSTIGRDPASFIANVEGVSLGAVVLQCRHTTGTTLLTDPLPQHNDLAAPSQQPAAPSSQRQAEKSHQQLNDAPPPSPAPSQSAEETSQPSGQQRTLVDADSGGGAGFGGSVMVQSSVLPFTTTSGGADQSYVVSPFTHYITYAREELVKLHWSLRFFLYWLLLFPLSVFFQLCSIDAVVYVNNWLLSTNLYPGLCTNAECLSHVTTELTTKFPNRAIIFRSVDSRQNPALFDGLKAAGYQMVFSRQVFYQDVTSTQSAVRLRKNGSFRSDLALLKASDYQLVAVDGTAQLGEAGLERLLHLYNCLYIQKYSTHNPQFTTRYLRACIDQKLLHVCVLRNKHTDALDGVLGYFYRNGVITTPLLGYDTSLPASLGLYRLLALGVTLEGIRLKAVVNMSGGVGRFKRLRGGLATVEYSAVFTGHLPFWRKAPWVFIRLLADWLAIPVIQFCEL